MGMADLLEAREDGVGMNVEDAAHPVKQASLFG